MAATKKKIMLCHSFFFFFFYDAWHQGKHIKSLNLIFFQPWKKMLPQKKKKLMQISIWKHVGERSSTLFFFFFSPPYLKGWHDLKRAGGWRWKKQKEENNNASLGCTQDRFLIIFLNSSEKGIELHFPVWLTAAPLRRWEEREEGGEKGGLVSSELDMNCPPGKRLWCDWHLSPLCLRHSN